MKTKLAALLMASVAVTGCDMMNPTVETLECATTQTECLNAWFDEKFQEELAFSPLRQTSLGMKTDYDKIDDFSLEAQREQLRWWQAATAEMEANFDYDELSDEAKLSWDMWQFRTERAESALEFADHDYILTQMGGTHAALPSFLLSQHTVESDSDMVAFIARIGGIGTAMDQLLERAQNNAEAGTRPPRFAYDAVIAESQKLISGVPFDESGEDSALWEGSEKHLADLVEAGTITEERADELREEARTALTGTFAPAYTRVINWFTEDRVNTSEEAQGVNQLAKGSDFYNHSLGMMTTTKLTADEIHDIGLNEVARIRAEMEAVKDQVGFEGSLQEFFVFTREDDEFFFSDDEAGAQAYIDRATMHIDELTARLPEFFGTLPKAPLEVRRVEPFREQDGAAQHYRAGTPDGSRPGIYYAHLSDMKAMPIPPLEAIAYHEGNPGHHMQVSIAQELEGIPKFRSQGGFISAYGEGWALYSEALAKEMGGYKDPYSEFGRLQSEMWRAIRLVVDTGIHAKGWTEDQAVAYCLENSPNPETVARSEVQRYFVLPGQATSYKIGMIRIQELRGKAEKELGEDFDIRGFHDTVLGAGALPLSILEKRVDQWIESVKAA
ncbi:DUF885 domain-containing protein [Erythrobacter sp. F6033]|uniref:DUF885 domain-containing protein n=1 Tax=Erythrobacter sp. F6033 TaxID=2926401 RepID=UPI001FF1E990|nr:DUF885 domain-containing protein [Erythrobacter sp. F6033]MCK0127133.1 DUF885 domain-containing protein [Erythrobacter sp. F6033]